MIIEETFTAKGFKAEILVTLDVTDDESHCYLECGPLSATLEAADAMGGFESTDGTLHIIPQETLNEIREWAEDNEY